jgi:hypothetical protein
MFGFVSASMLRFELMGVSGLAAVVAPLAEEPATLPGIVVIDGCFTCVDKKETEAES